MKKNIFSLSAIALTFAVMAGCGGKEAIIEQPVEPAFIEHNEPALRQQFNSKKALEELDKQMDAEFK